MPYLITPADVAAFQRCHRQWDFGASARQNLEPRPRPGRPVAPDLGQALREALGIYYFPGMWDWPRQITLPLVRQGFERALATQRDPSAASPGATWAGAAGTSAASAGAPGAGDDVWERSLAAGHSLLERYFGWAPAVDRFSPVLVEAEYDVTLLDPTHPERGLLTPTGETIRYRGQIGMLAVDAHDAYWIVYHRLAEGDWSSAADLAGDEEAAAACWAWEQFYLGMAITGTIYNELRLNPAEPTGPLRPVDTHHWWRPPWPAVADRQWWWRRSGVAGRWWRPRRPGPAGQVRQHEPSGGGRSIPHHRRMYAVAREPEHADRIEQQVTPEFRRTWVRRTPAEVAAAGRKLAETASQMTATHVSTEPTPSPAICPLCPYLAPCQAMMAGRDPALLLRSGYRERPAAHLAEGRLGGGAWGLGRGAAPPRFRDTRGDR